MQASVAPYISCVKRVTNFKSFSRKDLPATSDGLEQWNCPVKYAYGVLWFVSIWLCRRFLPIRDIFTQGWGEYTNHE